MPPKRKQPTRKTRQEPVDDVFGQVLDELKKLREEVNTLKEKQESHKMDTDSVL